MEARQNESLRFPCFFLMRGNKAKGSRGRGQHKKAAFFAGPPAHRAGASFAKRLHRDWSLAIVSNAPQGMTCLRRCVARCPKEGEHVPHTRMSTHTNAMKSSTKPTTRNSVSCCMHPKVPVGSSRRPLRILRKCDRLLPFVQRRFCVLSQKLDPQKNPTHPATHQRTVVTVHTVSGTGTPGTRSMTVATKCSSRLVKSAGKLLFALRQTVRQLLCCE